MLAHGRALLVDNDHTHISDANVFNPPELPARPKVLDAVDSTQPVALLHLCTSDPGDPAALMASYLDALPSGSYVVVSHCLDPENEHSHIARSSKRSTKPPPAHPCSAPARKSTPSCPTRT